MQRIYLAPVFVSLSLLASSIAVGLSACDVGQVAPGLGDGGTGVTGCTPDGGLPPTAPDGYYVSGNTVCTPAGKPHLLHGVDRPSLEWSPTGDNLSPADFQAMGSWHANVVRVALDQDFWLAGSPSHDDHYASLVDQVVQWAHAAALDVILDLHWSDCGAFGVKPGQQDMADQNSVEFWKEVATRYKGDGHVFFELYNEPNGIDAQTWLSGGMANCETDAGSYTAVGMQQLYDTVRATGANNLVIIGGVDYAYNLQVVQSGAVVGYNILYATHPYNNAPERDPDNWDSYWGYLTATNAVVVTEFGDGTGSCSPVWDQTLIPYADAHHASWTSWAWFSTSGSETSECQFPALLNDWGYDTTAEGAVVKTALLGYDDPSTLPPADAGSSATDGGDGGPGDAGTDAAIDGSGGSSGAGGSGTGGSESDGG